MNLGNFVLGPSLGGRSFLVRGSLNLGMLLGDVYISVHRGSSKVSIVSVRDWGDHVNINSYSMNLRRRRGELLH